MSKLSSFRRKLDPKKVWLAQQVAQEKIKIARQVVIEQAKKDAQFAADVLKAVGDNLPKEIKEACEESVKSNVPQMIDGNGLPTNAAYFNPPEGGMKLMEKQRKEYEASVKEKTLTETMTEDAKTNPAVKRLMEETKGLVAKWDKTGLLDGIKNDIDKSNMAVLIESEPKQIIEPIVGGDETYKLTKEVQLDGGGTILVDPNEEIMDGPDSAIDISPKV
jgi:CRISPR/Cas system CMR-associated protein Cmr5 small subunit